jgi:hypothetical protein
MVAVTKYAQVAILAAQYVKSGSSPINAWEKASCEIFTPGSSMQKKGCPKKAFLGLYGQTSVNGGYAKKGLDYLKKHGSESISPMKLWKIVTDGNGKTHNGQMDVVIALFDANLI